jgi:5'-nucleotidase (lipoprotein e(P4) family)
MNMKRASVWIIATAVLLSACHQSKECCRTTFALSQQNVDATIYQNTSAEGYRLFQQCYQLARIRLDSSLALQQGSLPKAVVVDVDETVLDNSPYSKRAIAESRTWDSTSWHEWVLLERAKALPGSVDFLRYAESRGCQVFYITNRLNTEREATASNLRKEGFPFADTAHVFTTPMLKMSDKTSRRDRVKKEFHVLLYCGDQLRDFDESFKDRTENYGRGRVDAMKEPLSTSFILLPNTLYGTWLDAVSGKEEPKKMEKKKTWAGANNY